MIETKKLNEYFTYNSRNAYYVQLKAIACRLLREEGYKIVEISNILNFKHHSGVIHLLNYYNDFCDFTMDEFELRVNNKQYPKYDKKELIWHDQK
jgi:hypothetical protein